MKALDPIQIRLLTEKNGKIDQDEPTLHLNRIKAEEEEDNQSNFVAEIS